MKTIILSLWIKKDTMDDIELVKRLSKNYTDVISRDECSKHISLNWGNNGVGDRWCKKKFCYTSIKATGEKLYHDKQDKVVEEPPQIQEFRKQFLATHKLRQGIIGIFVHYELTNEEKLQRPIRKDILNKYKSQPCANCSSQSDLVCDHKNDLYNDKRVLKTKTQLEDDFQSLCNHCNLLKRQVCKTEKQNQKLYSAKDHPQYKCFECDFPWEKKAFDENDPDLKSDTYWSDPIEFMRKCILYKTITIPIITELKRKVQKNIITKVQ